MALIITPGAPDADAFVSLADCEAYCRSRGLTDWTDSPTSPPDEREAAIRRATAFLSTGYRWVGARALGREQSLAWPRTEATDAEGVAIPDDVIPAELIAACCHVAAAEVANPGVMSPAVDMTARIKSERIGPMSTEYAEAPNQPELARPIILAVSDLLRGLVIEGAASIFGAVERT